MSEVRLEERSAGAEQAPERLEGLDLARALAILAMVLINFQVFLLARSDPHLLEIAPRWLIHLPSGRSSSLFVTLAGAGMALMARRSSASRARPVLLRRALFLLVMGNLLILVWWIDILHFYAFYLAFAALVFLRFTTRQLLPAAVVVTLFGALIGADYDGHTEYWSWTGMPLDLLVEGVHPLFPWLAFVLVGIWVGRQNLRDPGTQRRLMLGAATVAAVAELVSAALSALAAYRGWPPVVAGVLGTGWSPEPLFVLGASGTAVFTIAACQAVAQRFGRRWMVRALVAVGQLSLSIYVFHALVGVGVPRWLLGLEDAMSWRAVTLYWAGFCAAVVPLALLYRRRFSRGPLEWLMRRLAGTTPGGGAARPTRARARPPRWPWVAIGAAWLAILLIKVAGLGHPTLGCPDELPLVDRRASEITLTCPRRGFSLDVGAAGEVVLETRSSLDVMIELWGPTKRLAVDDDSGEGLNARLERRMAPGRYRVVVRPYSRALGPFLLSRR